MTEDLPSKSQRKRDMHALQNLGNELVELSDEQLAGVELPENLRDAVMQAREMTRLDEARRRQMQYIGKLMRHLDPEPIRKSIDAFKAVSHAQTARLHLLERLRTRLLEEDEALTELVNSYPQIDVSHVRLLIRNASRERAAGQPPKSYRALFQLLNETIPREHDDE